MMALTAGLVVSLFAGSASWEYAQMSGEMRWFDFSYQVDPRGLHIPHSVGLIDPLTMMLGSAREQEFFRANVVEALGERYRESLLEAGLDPADVLATSLEASQRTRIAPIDPTAIAQSVLKQMKSVTLDSAGSSSYSPADEDI